MRSLLLTSIFASLCLHCSVNDAANITPPANGTPDPGGPAANAPSGEAATTSVGGARLKARFLKTTDGAEFAQGIYDTQLGALCTVTMAADGKPRCLPSERYLLDDPELHFADATCQSSPLGGNYPFSTARFGYTRDAKTNGAHIYEATAKTPSNVPQSYRIDENGSCVPDVKDAPWYPLAEIAASDLVDGTFTLSADKGGVVAKTFHGSDGSHLFAGYAAAQTGTDCVVGLDANGTTRCLPLDDATGSSGNTFASSSCTGTRASMVDPRMDHEATFVAEKVGDTCGAPHTKIYAAKPTPAAYGLDAKGVCVAQTGKAVSVGAELAEATFPELTESAPWGQGRVKSLYYAVGNEPVSLRAQFDTTRNEGCSFGAPENGTATCLPFALRINSGYFADAACTTEAIADFSGSTLAGCNSAAPRYYLAPVDRAQEKQGHVYEISKLGDNPPFLFQQNKNGACEKITIVAPATYYQVGKEVPMTSFATATVLDR